MPGPFVHITLVDSLCQDTGALNRIPSLTDGMKHALGEFANYAELGAVSPDTPLLDPRGDARRWGNVMHYWQTADFIRRGIRYFDELRLADASTRRSLAWLFGFTAHVVTDLTVHPVVGALIGPYEGNEWQHRICELNQDVYIFHAFGLGNIGTAEYLETCGLATCVGGAGGGGLDPAIDRLWRHCLTDPAHETIRMENGALAPEHGPNPSEWFRVFVLAIGKFLEEAGRLPGLCRDAAEYGGVAYPEPNEVNPRFIQGLPLPTGGSGHYAEVFKMAVRNVMTTWNQLGEALEAKDEALFTLPNADLDTGLDDNKNSTFWG